MKFDEFTELDGNYTYEMDFEYENNTTERIFAIQLLEGTEYKLSFNVI